MITWSAYPHEKAGAYAYYQDLTLTAHPSGSWSVWSDPAQGKEGVLKGSKPDQYIPDKERNLDSAKRRAEAAAMKMIQTQTP